MNLAIEKGEFAAAVGPSGSGKTTLLNLIGAIDTPDTGTIRIGGMEITSTPADQLAEFRLRHLGFVFQSFNLFPVLSVLENLEFVPALQGVPKPERAAPCGAPAGDGGNAASFATSAPMS